ncbi:MAG: phosphotransferase family protein [Gammaproteobacteria bacterium]
MSDTDFTARLETFLARALPGFAALTACRRLSGGASQETYRLDLRTTTGPRTCALRRTAEGQPVVRTSGQSGLRNEARLLQMAQAGNVPVPPVLAVLAAGDGLGDGFLMPWLDGETLGHRIVRDPVIAALAPSLAWRCGQVLARIHALDVPPARLDEPLADTPPAALVEQTWARYRALGTPQPMIDYTARWLLANLPPSPRHTLVHGDFRNGNLMVGEQGIVAVLDWELAHFGDPLRDLGWLCTPSWRFGRADLPVGGFGTHAELFAGYTAESGFAVDPAAVRFWEIFGAFWWAVGCLQMADQYRHGPDRTVERPAIGRRSSECQVDCVNYLIPGPVHAVPAHAAEDTALPGIDELLVSVQDFLRREVVASQDARVQYLARVAANSLEIVRRDRALGDAARAAEEVRLRALLTSAPGSSLAELRRGLCTALRAGAFALDDPMLTGHLRATVANEVLIDQPRYPGADLACRDTNGRSAPAPRNDAGSA